jgi:chemotaxis protein methyltransferase CheR
MLLEDRDFIRLRDLMYSNFGINLAHKQKLIETRLNAVVTQKGFTDFSEYIDHILGDATGEEQHFKFMQAIALPEIVPRIRDNNLCIWSAGCSSGEEPYSIAMTLDDYFAGAKMNLDTRILATDISAKVLNAACAGVYSPDRMSKIPAHWMEKHFLKAQGDTYRVKPAVQKEVIFRNFNLMEKSFAFKKKFHIVFCRNVMIYFDAATREELAGRFYECIQPGGYLFIGMSETLASNKTEFKYISPSIYKKV